MGGTLRLDGPVNQVILEIPLPPSPNDRPAHPMQAVRWKNKTKRLTWMKACEQVLPSIDPPDWVAIGALFRVAPGQRRDEDNLVASLKYVLDALRKPRTRQERDWRRGIHEEKGFFVDDAPAHMTLTTIVQAEEPDPKRRGLRLVITANVETAA